MQWPAFFLLNVLNLMLNDRWFYCYCEYYEGPKDVNGSKNCCSICKIPVIFNDFEKDLDLMNLMKNFYVYII